MKNKTESSIVDFSAARRTKRIKAAQKLRWSKTATKLANRIDSGELRPDNYKRNPPR